MAAHLNASYTEDPNAPFLAFVIPLSTKNTSLVCWCMFPRKYPARKEVRMFADISQDIWLEEYTLCIYVLAVVRLCEAGYAIRVVMMVIGFESGTQRVNCPADLALRNPATDRISHRMATISKEESATCTLDTPFISLQIQWNLSQPVECLSHACLMPVSCLSERLQGQPFLSFRLSLPCYGGRKLGQEPKNQLDEFWTWVSFVGKQRGRRFLVKLDITKHKLQSSFSKKGIGICRS